MVQRLVRRFNRRVDDQDVFEDCTHDRLFTSDDKGKPGESRGRKGTGPHLADGIGKDEAREDRPPQDSRTAEAIKAVGAFFLANTHHRRIHLHRDGHLWFSSCGGGVRRYNEKVWNRFTNEAAVDQAFGVVRYRGGTRFLLDYLILVKFVEIQSVPV